MTSERPGVDAFLERWGPNASEWDVDFASISVDDHPWIRDAVLCEYVQAAYPPWLDPKGFGRYQYTNPDGSLSLKLCFGNYDPIDHDPEPHYYTLFSSMSVTLT